MDSTLIGVIIGSALSLFGTILSQIILSRKEQKQWENQQVAEQKSWSRNVATKENEFLREIYQNSLRSLSVFIALENQEKTESSEQQKIELIDEVHKWVTMLLLRHSSSELDDALNSFTSDPDKYSAKRLRTEIINLSNKEESFFLKELNNQSEEIKPDLTPDPDIRIIQIAIDNDYRKQQLIDGIEITQNANFQLKLSEMSSPQREKLTEVFFQSNKTIPSRFSLFLPIYNERSKQIQAQGKRWEAKLNPNIAKPLDILCSWEEDYAKSYQEASDQFKAQKK